MKLEKLPNKNAKPKEKYTSVLYIKQSVHENEAKTPAATATATATPTARATTTATTTKINNVKAQIANSETVSYNDESHHASHVNLLRIPRAAPDIETFGFHLTRSQWDPYPWISGVDAGTPASQCGLEAGDCVLEINGHDVLGKRIADIAELIRVNRESVTLAVWSTNCQEKCEPESICCAPMPRTLQRLSVIVQSILSIIECPVCLDTITPPAMQCQNGHLLCVNCRIRAEKCPICRDHYTPRRALIAEKIYATITSAFDLCHNEDKLRGKLFGRSRLQQRLLQAQMQHKDAKRQRILTGWHLEGQSKARLPTNKFLTKLLQSKAYSMDNLMATNPCTLLAANTFATDEMTSTNVSNDNSDTNNNTNNTNNKNKSSGTVSHCNSISINGNLYDNASTMQSCSNQFHCRTNTSAQHRNIDGRQKIPQAMTATRLTTRPRASSTAAAPPAAPPAGVTAIDAIMMMKPKIKAATAATAAIETTNNATQSNAISKHFSLSANDLYAAQQNVEWSRNPNAHQCVASTTNTTTATTAMMTMTIAATAGAAGAAMEAAAAAASGKSNNCNNNNNKNNSSNQNHQAANVRNSIVDNKNQMLLLPFIHEKRSSCKSLSSSIECIRRSSLQCECDDNKSTLDTELLSLAETIGTSTKTMPLSTAALGATIQSAAAAAAGAAAETPRAAVATPEAAAAAHKSKLSRSKSAYAEEQLYRCPCICDARFADSAQLQQHVKVQHRQPIVSVGAARTQLTLPLRTPLDNAVLVLELNANEDDAEDVGNFEAEHIKTGHECEPSRECWLSVRMQGQDCIAANAIYQAPKTASVNFTMTAN